MHIQNLLQNTCLWTILVQYLYYDYGMGPSLHIVHKHETSQHSKIRRTKCIWQEFFNCAFYTSNKKENMLLSYEIALFFHFLKHHHEPSGLLLTSTWKRCLSPFSNVTRLWHSYFSKVMDSTFLMFLITYHYTIFRIQRRK